MTGNNTPLRPFSKAVIVYRIVPVAKRTIPIIAEPKDIMIIFVEMNCFSLNKIKTLFTNTAAIISKAIPGSP